MDRVKENVLFRSINKQLIKLYLFGTKSFLLPIVTECIRCGVSEPQKTSRLTDILLLLLKISDSTGRGGGAGLEKKTDD